MSIRHVVSAALLGTAIAAGSAAAQSPVHFGLAAGASIPNGDFSNGQATGYHGMAVLNFGVPLAPVGLRVDGMYNSFSGKDFTIGALSGKTDDYRVMTANANVVLQVPGAIVAHPYVIGGLGYYRGQSAASGSTSTSKVGYNAGIGLNLGLSGFSTFVEARYHIVPNYGGSNSSSLKFIPITFGVMF